MSTRDASRQAMKYRLRYREAEKVVKGLEEIIQELETELRATRKTLDLVTAGKDPGEAVELIKILLE